MSDKLAVIQEQVIAPQTFNELRTLAKDIADAGMAKNQGEAMVRMMAGRDLGFTYMQSVASIYVLDGKPGMYADAMVAICLERKDICEKFYVEESTNERCIVVVKRVGRPERKVTFTMEDAIQAQLWKKNGNYDKYPARMLKHRAEAFAARDEFPDLMRGMSSKEELEDIRQERLEKVAVQIEKKTRKPKETNQAEGVTGWEHGPTPSLRQEDWKDVGRVPDAEVVDESVIPGETIGQAMAARIAEVQSVEALKAFIDEIKALGDTVDEHELALMRGAYKARKMQLEGR